MARRRRRRIKIDTQKERLKALDQEVPGDPNHPHALCTKQGRVLRTLIGGALSKDRDGARAIAQGILEGDEARESASERWRESAERVERAAARCAGAEEVVERTNMLYERIGAAARDGDEAQMWEAAAAPIASTIEATSEDKTGLSRREAAKLAQRLEANGATTQAAETAGIALEHLCEALMTSTTLQQQQGRERLGLREEVSEALLRQCALRSNAENVQRETIEPMLKDGLEAISYDDQPVRKIAEIAATTRAPDGNPVMVFTGTYPFDPDNPVFNRNRNQEQGSRKAANVATNEWIEGNGCIIPVLMDKDGKIIGDNASAKIFRVWAKDNPEETLARCAIAGYDGKNDRVTVRKVERYPSGQVTAGALSEWLKEGRGEGTSGIATEDKIGMNPEQWDGPTAEPGKPVFVLVREEERCAPGSRAAESQAPHHISSLSKTTPDQHATAHPHALAISAAARLGGARNLWVMTGEITQGKLFRTSTKKRGPDEEPIENHALVSLPVHRSIANASAMGAGAIHVGVHPGAPWGKDQSLEKRSPDLYARQGREKDDPVRYDAEGGRATAIGEMEVWGDTAEDRGHAIEREDILDARAIGGRDPMRITCICDPESVKPIMEMLAETQWDAIEVTFPEPLWRLRKTAENAREAVKEYFPRGSTRAMPRDRMKTEQTRMNDKEIVIGGGGTESMNWKHTDLVLLGDIDPSKKDHYETMDWIAQATREGNCTATMAAVGKKSVFALNQGFALVWGNEQARHHAGLRGDASKEGFVRAHPKTAEWLLGRRHAELNAVQMEAKPPYISIPDPKGEDEQWERAAQKLHQAASESGQKNVIGAVNRQTAALETRLVKIDPRDLETPPTEPTMRLMKGIGTNPRHIEQEAQRRESELMASRGNTRRKRNNENTMEK